MKQRSFFSLFLIIGCMAGLTACQKDNKNTTQAEESIHETENQVREIEAQYESTSDDFNDGHPPAEQLEQIEVISTSDENDQAAKELRKYVAIHRDLVKKHKATGNVEFKNQALLIEEKARKVQQKLANSHYQAKSAQIRDNGDLFLEMEASIQDLRN